MENSIINRIVSDDGGTKKYLIVLHDGETVESVLMPCKHGFTICISTQVGCGRKCLFCATGKGGLRRNLTLNEMIFQINAIQETEKIKITCVVLMGMGEPFDNYDEVIKFVDYLSESASIPASRIKISRMFSGSDPMKYT